MNKPETFEGIDFEAIKDVTGLETDEIKVLKICFNMFDVKDQAFLSADDLDDILRGMGFRPSKEELKEILEEIDEDGSGEIEFEEFCQLCAKFLIEEPDEETMKAELKEAFRVYDKEANGFITTDQLREIISELDQRLTVDDLDGIIEEIDEDGSGTMDFDEFCAMMMS
ncbi:troponin C, isotype gamma [Lepeophtheirus salmonis]|uniref:Troponin C, isoform 1 n=1 Tax=Lepeophtheirus salmonis TaxID=72036 RepID=C1BUU1_LEPSM|nr:troponin C, isotype gamma-like [Lepeophtheirus salmonis]ACO12794.1 Troponin C, isoform 1 [Lepeophtheirus salmonis]ACO12864.1 Troponin C, isoform 1 [Lepeophtheirus salmonis]